jgi:hypothetical protein
MEQNGNTRPGYMFSHGAGTARSRDGQRQRGCQDSGCPRPDCKDPGRFARPGSSTLTTSRVQLEEQVAGSGPERTAAVVQLDDDSFFGYRVDTWDYDHIDETYIPARYPLTSRILDALLQHDQWFEHVDWRDLAPDARLAVILPVEIRGGIRVEDRWRSRPVRPPEADR